MFAFFKLKHFYSRKNGLIKKIPPTVGAAEGINIP